MSSVIRMLLCLHCHLSSIFNCQLFSLEEPLIENHFIEVVSKLNVFHLIRSRIIHAKSYLKLSDFKMFCTLVPIYNPKNCFPLKKIFVFL